MLHRKPRRFRRRSNGRNHMSHNNSQNRMRTNPFSNGQPRGNFRSQMSAEKSFEKYTSLAKEAMSAGDKTLSENYLQHADHFMRIIEDKNKNKNQIKNTLNDILNLMKKLLGLMILVMLLNNVAKAASIVDELTKLNNLYKEGAITKEEFSKAKEILFTSDSTEETKSVDSTHVEQKEEINKKV